MVSSTYSSPQQKSLPNIFIGFIMHRFFIFLLFSGMACAAEPIRIGELLVCFSDGVNPDVAVKDWSHQHPEWNLSLGPLRSSQLKCYEIFYRPEGDSPDRILVWVKQQRSIRMAQHNHSLQKRSTEPNDSLFPKSWHWSNTGQQGGLPGADVDALSAWDSVTSSALPNGDTALVAVVDGGADRYHPDLHFWTNAHEVPGNGIDDDQNGYVDDVRGWNAFNQTDSFPRDPHGTHVCGLVGARGNNGRGVCGAVWGLPIIPIRGSSTNEATVVEAYSYALSLKQRYLLSGGNMGACIVAINSSFGVDNGMPSQYPIWCEMFDSLGAAGILSVSATTNNRVDVDAVGDMPTRCSSPYQITVTSSNRNDGHQAGGLGLFSVDLAAPGHQIWSTYPGGGYVAYNGTSMAAPQVAGAIALLCGRASAGLALALRQQPAAAAVLLKRVVMQSVDPLLWLTDSSVSGGRLNLKRAIDRLPIEEALSLSTFPTATNEPSCYVWPQPARNQCRIHWVSGDLRSIRLYNTMGQTVLFFSNQLPGVFDVSSLEPGIYLLQLSGEHQPIKLLVN